MKDNKKMVQLFSVLALFLAVVGISIGFAAMSTSLSIRGTAKVVPATWDVKFTSKEFSDNSTAATASEAGTLTDTTFYDYEITLTKPGDKGTFLVTVTNGGTIDAKVGTVTLGSGALTMTGDAADVAKLTGHINYNVTWADGTAIATNDTLPHTSGNNTRQIKIEVEYDPLATELPAAPVTISGRDLTMTFVQA